MKKFLKKTITFAIAAIMVLAMAVPTFAAIDATENGDNVDLKITGVQNDAATVTGKQVVKGIYNTAGDSFVGWEYAKGSKDGVAYEVVPADSTKVDDDTHKYLKLNMDGSEPTEAQINAIAKALAEGKLTPLGTVTLAADTASTEVGDYKVNVKAKDGSGVYIVDVVPGGNDQDQYNPILLSARYNKQGQFGQGAGNLGAYNTGTVKKTSPGVQKSVSGGVEDENVMVAERAKDAAGNFLFTLASDPTKTTTEIDKAGDRLYKKADGTTTTDINQAVKTKKKEMTGGVGTVLTYTLTPTLPVYPADAVNKTFYLSDTLSAGLTYMIDSLDITVEGMTLTKTTDAGVITWKNGNNVVAQAKEANNGFNIYFEYDNLKVGDAVKAPIVTYKGVVNTAAVLSVPGNPNLAEMFYAKNSNEGSTYKNLDDKPDAEDYSYKNDEKVVYTYQFAFKKTNDKDEGQEGFKVLKDVEFGLYADQACSQLISKIKTNEAGWGFSDQLAKGTYYLKEIKAPEGYSLLTAPLPINIDWKESSKTTTSTTSHTRTTYTAVESEAQKDVDGTAKQAGWFVKNGDQWVFIKDKSAYTTESETVKKAYVKTMTESTESSTTLETYTDKGHTYVLTNIKNTEVNELPSTGGMGTYIFTIVGVAVVALAAAMLIFRKKRA